MNNNKLVWIFLCILVSTTSSQYIIAQTPPNIELEWRKTFNRYKKQLLSDEKRSQRLFKIFSKWNKFELQKTDFLKVTHQILWLSEINYTSFKELKKKLLESNPNSDIFNHLTREDIKAIQANTELLDMIRLGLFHSLDFPFITNCESEIIMELKSYKLDSIKTLGEIGNGNGNFSLLLHLVNPEIKLYLNELEKPYLKYQKRKVNRNPMKFNRKKFNFIKGEENSTNLEGKELDVIVIRDSFHHFSKKYEMIESIRKSLRKNGKLFIIESIPELDLNNNTCKHAISKKELVNILTSKDLQILNETIIGEKLLIELEFTN